MSDANLISTGSNQNKLVRYGFVVIVIAIIAYAASLFWGIFNDSVVKPVPDGYKFSVVDHATNDKSKWATYYVYDTYIIIYKDQKDESSKSSQATIYEGLDTSNLVYDETATAKTCDSAACYSYPKVLDSIKKMLVNRQSREYVRM